MLRHQRLTGVEGWLRLLVILMVFIWPLAAISQQHSFVRDANLAYHPSWQPFVFMGWALVFGRSVWFVWAGYQLYKQRKPAAVKTGVVALWRAGPGLTFLGGVILMMQDFAPMFDASVVWRVIVVECVISGIWTAYLLKSERVANTYRLESSIPVPQMENDYPSDHPWAD